MKPLDIWEETLVSGAATGVQTLYEDITGKKVFYDRLHKTYSWGTNFEERSCTFPGDWKKQIRARYRSGEKIATIMNSLGAACPRAV